MGDRRCRCHPDCATFAECMDTVDPTAETITLTIPSGFVDDECDYCDQIPGVYVLNYDSLTGNGYIYKYSEEDVCSTTNCSGVDLDIEIQFKCLSDGKCQVAFLLNMDGTNGIYNYSCQKSDYPTRQSSWTVPTLGDTDYGDELCNICVVGNYPPSVYAEITP